MLNFGVRHGEHVFCLGGKSLIVYYISRPKTATQQESISETHRNQPQVFQLRKSWKFKRELHEPKIPMESENLNMYSVILVVTVAVEGWTQYLNMLKRWFQLMFCRVLKGGCFCCEIRLMEEIMHYLESWMCVDGDILHIVPWDSSPFLLLQMGLAWITQPYPTPKKSNRQKARRYHFHGVEERILGALVASISVRDSHAGGVGRWPVVGCSEKRMTFANFS